MLLMITILAFYTYWLISGIVFLIDYKKHPQQCGYIKNYNKYFNSLYRKDIWDSTRKVLNNYYGRIYFEIIVAFAMAFILVKYENVLRIYSFAILLNLFVPFAIAEYAIQFSYNLKAIQESDHVRYANLYLPLGPKAILHRLSNKEQDPYSGVRGFFDAKHYINFNRHRFRYETRKDTAIVLVITMAVFIIFNIHIFLSSGYMDNEKVVFNQDSNIEKRVIYYDEIDHIEELITHNDSVYYYIVTKDENKYEIGIACYDRECFIRLRQRFELVIFRE